MSAGGRVELPPVRGRRDHLDAALLELGVSGKDVEGSAAASIEQLVKRFQMWNSLEGSKTLKARIADLKVIVDSGSKLLSCIQDLDPLALVDLERKKFVIMETPGTKKGEFTVRAVHKPGLPFRVFGQSGHENELSGGSFADQLQEFVQAARDQLDLLTYGRDVEKQKKLAGSRRSEGKADDARSDPGFFKTRFALYPRRSHQEKLDELPLVWGNAKSLLVRQCAYIWWTYRKRRPPKSSRNSAFVRFLKSVYAYGFDHSVSFQGFERYLRDLYPWYDEMELLEGLVACKPPRSGSIRSARTADELISAYESLRQSLFENIPCDSLIQTIRRQN